MRTTSTTWLGQLGCLLLFLLALAGRPAAAQVQMATTVITATNVANPTAAVDTSMTTAAQLLVPALYGVAQLRLGFTWQVPAGTQASLDLGSVGVLDASALSNLVVNTYQSSSTGSNKQQSFAVRDLVTVSALNSGKTRMVFPVSREFNQVELVATGLLNVGYGVQVFAALGQRSAPLPVQLVAFTGQAGPAGVQLRWQTASEANSAYFVVERATTAELAYQPLGQVAAAGTSSQSLTYRFTDAEPAAAPQAYYRLRQVDQDGQQHVGPVVVVSVPTSAAELVAVYPSLATDWLTVTGPAGAQLVVADYQGRPVQALAPGTGQAQQVSVGALPSGMYLVRNLTSGRSTRFVKQ